MTKDNLELPKMKNEDTLANGLKNKIIYYLLVFGIPTFYLIYEAYLVCFKQKNEIVTYTNVEGMLTYFGVYVLAIVINLLVAKKNLKFILYILTFLEFAGVMFYIMKLGIVDDFLDILNVLLLSTPFITSILQNLNIKK